MSNISNEVSTPCNKLWLNSNNVITIMIIISCTSMMRHAKGPILCLFCNAQNFSLRKLWKKVVLVNKTFFGHVPSLSPYHYVQLTCRNELYWPEKITFWRRKNWIRKRKNKIQNCKWKKRQLEKRATFKHKIVHATWCKKRTTDNRRQPSTFYQAQCETVHQITKQKSFLEKNKDLRTAYKK